MTDRKARYSVICAPDQEDGDQVLAEALFAFAVGDEHSDVSRMLVAASRARELERLPVRLSRTLDTHRARWLGVCVICSSGLVSVVFGLCLRLRS